MAWLKRAAEQGYDLAQLGLGKCYYIVSNDDRSYAEAATWFRKAAENNNSEAQAALGQCYYDGIGVNQSYEEAAIWFKKAAEQNNAFATIKLSKCYYYGYGLPKSYDEAKKWYNALTIIFNKERRLFEYAFEDMLSPLVGYEAIENQIYLPFKNYKFIEQNNGTEIVAYYSILEPAGYRYQFDPPKPSEYCFKLNLINYDESLDNCVFP